MQLEKGKGLGSGGTTETLVSDQIGADPKLKPILRSASDSDTAAVEDVRDRSDPGSPMLTEAEATRLTTRIHLLLGPHLDQRDKLVSMVTEAREGDAHLALGYRSWTAYVSEQFGDLLPRLARTERLPFVELMADEGMSTRAIAAVIHTSHQTVANDLKSAVKGALRI